MPSSFSDLNLTSKSAMRALRMSCWCLEARCPRIPTTDAILGIFFLAPWSRSVVSLPALQKSFRPQFSTRVIMVVGKQELKKQGRTCMYSKQKMEYSRAPVTMSQSMSSSHRASVTEVQSQSSRHRASVTELQSQRFSHRALVTEFQNRAPVTMSQSQSSSHSEPITEIQSWCSSHRAPVTLSQSASSNHRAPVTASHRAPVTVSQSQSSSHSQPVTELQSQSASNRAPVTVSQSQSSSHSEPVTELQSQWASHRAPVSVSQPQSSGHGDPINTFPMLWPFSCLSPFRSPRTIIMHYDFDTNRQQFSSQQNHGTILSCSSEIQNTSFHSNTYPTAVPRGLSSWSKAGLFGVLVSTTTPESRSAVQVAPLEIWIAERSWCRHAAAAASRKLHSYLLPPPFPPMTFYHRVGQQTVVKLLFWSLHGHQTCLVQ